MNLGLETGREVTVNRNTRIALGAGVAALAAGAVGPWVTAFGGIISLGPTASAETSLVVFGGIAAVALAALVNRWMRAASIVAGVLAVAEAIYALVKIEQAKSDAGEFGALISPGWGLYLTIIAGTYLVGSTWIARMIKARVDLPVREPAG
jgi:hypothetical protein